MDIIHIHEGADATPLPAKPDLKLHFFAKKDQGTFWGQFNAIDRDAARGKLRAYQDAGTLLGMKKPATTRTHAARMLGLRFEHVDLLVSIGFIPAGRDCSTTLIAVADLLKLL